MNRRSLAVVALVLLGYVALVAAATEGRGEIGRYQATAVFRDTGAIITVIVIDTTTGEIVSMERPSYKAYAKAK